MYIAHCILVTLNHTATKELVLLQLCLSIRVLYFPDMVVLESVQGQRGLLLDAEMLHCQLLWVWEEQMP